MSLITIIVVLIVIGIVLWMINNYIPMDSKIKSIINIVIIVAVVIWLLQSFGIIGSLSHLTIK
jgi:undecaprenyl pyrophosphate phosphatase UppP